MPAVFDGWYGNAPVSSWNTGVPVPFFTPVRQLCTLVGYIFRTWSRNTRTLRSRNYPWIFSFLTLSPLSLSKRTWHTVPGQKGGARPRLRYLVSRRHQVQSPQHSPLFIYSHEVCNKKNLWFYIYDRNFILSHAVHHPSERDTPPAPPSSSMLLSTSHISIYILYT